MRRAGWGLVLLAACGESPPDRGECRETLAVGDLVITEIFADADAPPGGSGADEGREWFELYNATDRTLDLEGVTVRLERSDGSGARLVTLGPLVVAAGQYATLGNVVDATRPSWIDAGYGEALGDLYNTGGGRLAVACGTTSLDVATFEGVVAGASQQFDGSTPPDAASNDDLSRWCAASPDEGSTAFAEENFGTPGAANQDCEVIVPGRCVDAGFDAVARDTVAPSVGQLVITELMASPTAVDDALGEWVEVLALADIDLNDVALDRAGDTRDPDPLAAERCLHLPAGQRAVLARSADAALNGGLPEVAGTFRFTLVGGSAATPGDVRLLVGDTLIDAFSWTAPVGDGQSLQVDPDHETAVGNDAERVWCDGLDPYGAGDRGSPGAANLACEILPADGFCIDAGGLERSIVAPAVGDLVLTEIMPSPDAVDDAVGEWFEVVATADVDLNGLGLDRVVDTRNPDRVTQAACLPVTAGDRVVFARSDDAASNGGLPPVAGTFGFTLVGGSPTAPGDVRLLWGDTVLDAFAWTTPVGNGASLALDPDLVDVASNDTERFWCDATTSYGAGDPPDLGTPGEDNLQCTIPPPPGFCLDGGVERAIDTPAVGELVLTEVMPSPAAVFDEVGEWIEVLALAPLDLNGLALDREGDTRSADVIEASDCRPVAAGTRLVFARSELDNGGLPTLAGTFGFTLVTGSVDNPGDVRLLVGDTVLDSFAWTGGVQSGQSLQVDPDHELAAGNDEERFWCAGLDDYGAGDPPDRGSPGGANRECDIPPPAGFCRGVGGVERAIVTPTVGQLRIEEWMPNPNLVADSAGEWVELVATAAVDLNGLQVGAAVLGATPVVPLGPDCVALAAGDRFLLARDASSAINGGLPTPDALYAVSLVNSNGTFMVGVADAVLASVSWTSSVAGRAILIDSTATQCDVPASTAAYNGVDLGTPRAPSVQECP